MKKKNGVVAAGDKHTAKAAQEILEQGGNAYDAILASFIAAPITEPVLSSLGGGGFLLARPYGKKARVYDFFVQTPHKKAPASRADFFSKTAHFGNGVTQDFYIGLGSIAMPGSVKGIFQIHKQLGSLPLSTIAEPAVRYARSGIALSRLQSFILEVVGEIYRSNQAVFDTYQSKKHSDKLLQEGEKYRVPAYADFIETLVREGEALFYQGDVVKQVLKDIKQYGGHLTQKDFDSYQSVVREPLTIDYKGNQFITNPPPSSGGILIAFALKLLEGLDNGTQQTEGQRLETIARVMEATEKARIDEGLASRVNGDSILKLLNNDLLDTYKQGVLNKVNRLGSTTHMSVIDAAGNIASMTVTNGEGSAYMVPGTGIMMNNMLGEEDLNPNGLGNWREGERMSSMMAPSILLAKTGNMIALGSGGSNRIRSAILQTILHIAENKSIRQAVENPRIHFENNKLNAEIGFETSAVSHLNKSFENVHVWDDTNMFFGGVHTASYNTTEFEGAGDPRRGGVCFTT